MKKSSGGASCSCFFCAGAHASRVIALDFAFNSERTLVYRAEEVRVFDPGRRRSYEEDIRALLIDDN
jgi:hypothetical protein